MRVAGIQMTSGSQRADNLQTAERWIRKAAALGANLVALPENFSWMGPQAEREKAAETLDGPTLGRMAALAKELGLAVLAGSILERGGPGGRFYNTCVLLDEKGQPGSEVVVGRVFGLTVGLSVCYDLRFPELYRRLSSLGATLLVVPSAFTLMTGKDHWEVLLRARAIENLAYVLAPAQHGRHSEN